MAKFIIYNKERGKYWVQSGFGYTIDKSRAGRFTESRAKEIVNDANVVKVEEVMLLESAAPAISLDVKLES
ncbi:hypothetical protein [Vibrio harveyi]|uniref:hypothetical protein n=1 Tax=Vibrio harveyi TaxID=669 RepID=UPI00217EEB6E|nr:hypothetical protein [Vibrio harveyi]